MEGDFLRTTDIAELLGVSRQRVQRLSRQPDFPEPVLQASRMKLWRRSDIEEWMRGAEWNSQDSVGGEWQTEIEGEVARRLRMLLESLIEHVGEPVKPNVFVWLRPKGKWLEVLASDSYAVVFIRVATLAEVETRRRWLAVNARELVYALHLGILESALGVAYARGDEDGVGREVKLWRMDEERRPSLQARVYLDDEMFIATGDGKPRTREELRGCFGGLFANVSETDGQENEATIGDYGMGFLEVWWRALRHPDVPSDIRLKVTGPGSHVFVTGHYGDDLHFRGIFMTMPDSPSTG